MPNSQTEVRYYDDGRAFEFQACTVYRFGNTWRAHLTGAIFGRDLSKAFKHKFQAKAWADTHVNAHVMMMIGRMRERASEFEKTYSEKSRAHFQGRVNNRKEAIEALPF